MADRNDKTPPGASDMPEPESTMGETAELTPMPGEEIDVTQAEGMDAMAGDHMAMEATDEMIAMTDEVTDEMMTTDPTDMDLTTSEETTMPGTDVTAMMGADEMQTMPGEDIAGSWDEDLATMPGEETALTATGDMDMMPNDEMVLTNGQQGIELPGTWKLKLTQTGR